MTLSSVLGCQVCSALEKQNVPRRKVFFGAKCPSAFIFGILSRGDLCLIHRYNFLLYNLRSSESQSSRFLKPCILKFEVMKSIKSSNGEIYA